MRILTLFMFLVFVVALAGFVSLNRGQQIQSVSLGFKVVSDITMNTVVAWAFGLGVLWTLVVCITQEIRLRLRIAGLKSSIGRLQHELDQLRTIPLAEFGIEEKEEQ